MTDRELLERAAKAAGYTWSKSIADERAARGLVALWLIPADGSLGSIDAALRAFAGGIAGCGAAVGWEEGSLVFNTKEYSCK